MKSASSIRPGRSIHTSPSTVTRPLPSGEGLPELQRALRQVLEARVGGAPRAHNTGQAPSQGHAGGVPARTSRQPSADPGSSALGLPGHTTDDDATARNQEMAAEEVLSDEERFLLGLPEEELAELSEQVGSLGSQEYRSVSGIPESEAGTSMAAVIGGTSSFKARRKRALAAAASPPPLGYSYIGADDDDSGRATEASQGDGDHVDTIVGVASPSRGGNGGEDEVLSEEEAWLMDLSEGELLALIQEVEVESKS